MIGLGKKMFLVFLFTLVLLITLFFGLKPRGFRFANQVDRLGDGGGIAFPNGGMVYSRGTLGEIGISDSLSIAFTIKPYRTGRQLSKVVSLIDGEGRALLEVEQWSTELLVTMWDPDGTRIGRIGIEDALSADALRSAVVAVSHGRMRVSIDESAGLQSSCGVTVPVGFFENCRILIGLSATGRNPWRGEMEELGIFRETVSGIEIGDFEKNRLGRFGLQTFRDTKPSAMYYFNELSGSTVADRSGNGWNLEIPAYPRMFKYEVLTLNLENPLTDRGLAMDMIVNLLGFIPFGACLSLCLGSFIEARKRTIVTVVVCAALVSLGIELLQVFIPTRTSQLLDVILNTAGALIGAAVIHVVRRRKSMDAS
jgi:VanZ family protein